MKKLFLLVSLCWVGGAGAEELSRRELRIPMPEAGPGGLEALLVFPNDGGRHPLVLLSHRPLFSQRRVHPGSSI